MALWQEPSSVRHWRTAALQFQPVGATRTSSLLSTTTVHTPVCTIHLLYYDQAVLHQTPILLKMPHFSAIAPTDELVAHV